MIKVSTDKLFQYFVATSFSGVKVFYECPSECTACHFPNNCSNCVDGYQLEMGKCTQQGYSNCVKNKFIDEGICELYCDESCKTCNQTKYDCVECAEFYTKDADGKCIIENQSLSIFKDIRPFLTIFRKRGYKWVFMVVDDLWLYQYHQKEYDGIIRDVFKTIAFIEEKQWEIVGLEEYLSRMKDNIKELPRFNAYSNLRYMEESRKNNALLDNIFDYLVVSVPFTLILWFIYYRTFYCLFEFEISKYLRAYSFCLILFDLLIQGNIEYFTFLAIRALDVFFSFNVSSTFF